MTPEFRTALICHADDLLNSQALPRWLPSFSHLAGLVVIDETGGRLWRRIRREVKRVGWLRFADVLAFRLYYKCFLRKRDRRWEDEKLAELCQAYPAIPTDTPVLHTRSPNTPEVEAFLKAQAPTLLIARCKTLLKESIFSVPARGTFVMHPGICPEYRNAHGCFWALARNDVDNVGMTLLKIDKGVDTGPVHGYFRCDLGEERDSHIVLQHRVVFDNLELIKDSLLAIARGESQPLDTAGRPSGEWGQPWLTAYWTWQRHARQRREKAHLPDAPGRVSAGSHLGAPGT